jgi:hypothetical protein
MPTVLQPVATNAEAEHMILPVAPHPLAPFRLIEEKDSPERRNVFDRYGNA